MTQGLDLTNWLQTTQIFHGLSRSQLLPLNHIAQLISFKKGEIIFHQGSPATGFFIVKAGRVKAFKLSLNGKEQILHIFSPGDHFAEVPALDGNVFPASAATLDISQIVFFPRIAFVDLLYQDPAITINMLISLSQHSRHLSNLVEELSFKDVPQRLAAYLLNLDDHLNNNSTVHLDLHKSQLAAVLGTIPATLSRAFYRLSSEGMIAIHGSHVELLDRDRLQYLSQALE